LLVLIISFSMAQTVTDYDGNVYNTVTIGTQTWTKENLKSLHYSDGTAITGVSAYNGDNSNVAIYGRLYTWDAAMHGTNVEMTQGVCPTGWHLANNKEWDTLITFLGGSNVAGGKLKESGSVHWTSNTGADNSSSFTALPGGFYFNSMMYVGINTMAKFWTSSVVTGSSGAYNCSLINTDGKINDGSSSPVGNEKSLGASIRCLKGQGFVGIKQNSSKSSFEVYPNPSVDFITVEIQNLSSSYSYSLIDVTGKQVLSGTIDNSIYRIDLKKLSKGIYIFRASNNTNEIVKKIFVK
jgi:uncharacterized protein (TIGR02145 family)